jgi:hypothetical protein
VTSHRWIDYSSHARSLVERAQDWFDVEDRRTVHRFEVSHPKPTAVDQQDLNAVKPDRGWAGRRSEC